MQPLKVALMQFSLNGKPIADLEFLWRGGIDSTSSVHCTYGCDDPLPKHFVLQDSNVKNKKALPNSNAVQLDKEEPLDVSCKESKAAMTLSSSLAVNETYMNPYCS